MSPRKSIVAVLAALFLLACASPAAATTTVFEAGEYPAALSGQQTTKLKFGFEGNSAECGKVTFSGTQPEISETIDLEASFSECTAFGFAATVAMNTCKFRLNANTATAGVICGATPLKINVSNAFAKCEVQIGESGNTKLSKIVDSTAATTPKTVTSKFELSGMTANKTVSTGLCPLTTGTTTKASLTGEISLKATGVEKQMDFVVEAFNPPVLCPEAAAAQPCATTYGVGTSLRAQVLGANEPTFRFNYNGNPKVVKCAESEIQPTTDNTGVATLNGVVSILSFSKCEEPCGVTASNLNYKMLMMRGGQPQGNGRVEITQLGANGSPTFTIACTGSNPCAYVTAVLWGTFTGGQPAALSIDKRVFNGVAGNAAACGAQMTFEDDVYSLLEPEPAPGEKGKAWLIS